jgi:uncharacterized membrane protein YjgN (DUF898 family)
MSHEPEPRFVPHPGSPFHEAPSRPVPSTSMGTWRMEFRGSGGSLFAITFVNALLNVFTLGIWFAWGRVRELRFLVGSTWVAGDPMSFHGRGGELFRGVLIAFFVLVVPLLALFFWAASETGASAALGMIAAYLGFGLLVAFASVGSLRYRLPRTEWRGIRFGFDGKPTEFLRGYLWRAALVVVTVGLYYPVYACWRRKWILSRTRFGTVSFDCDPESQPLFDTFLVCWFLGFVTFGLSFVWYQGHLQGYLWNRSRVGDARFTSKMTGEGWLKFQLVNLLLVMVTFGIAAPWVTTRSHSYFLSHLRVDDTLDLAAVQQRLQAASGVGEGALDILDVGSGLDLG